MKRKLMLLAVLALASAKLYGMGDVLNIFTRLNEVKERAGEKGMSLPFSIPINPHYCPAVPPEKKIPTLKDKAMRDLVKPDILELVEKYSPVLYLHKEEVNLPIKVEEYFTGTTTRVNFYTGPGYSGENDTGQPNLTTVIPRGQVTMTKIYDDLYKQADKYRGGRLYFQNDECAKYGSNPAENTDAQGNLTTPNYVRVFEHKDSPGKLFIHYVQTYGLNGPYTIRTPYLKHSPLFKSLFAPGGVLAPGGLLGSVFPILTQYPEGAALLAGDVLDFQNAHEFDLEHITLEFNKTEITPAADKGKGKAAEPNKAEKKYNYELKQIYFGSHGRDEGYWLPTNHPDVAYENGTHPVVYVAHGGHGNYNKAGTYVRILGIANDITGKHKRWVPELSIFYEETEPEFRKEWMAWQYHPDSTGRRGVSSYWAKNWAGTDKQEGAKGDEGRPYPYEKIPYCPVQELVPTDDAGKECLVTKAFSEEAMPPD